MRSTWTTINWKKGHPQKSGMYVAISISRLSDGSLFPTFHGSLIYSAKHNAWNVTDDSEDTDTEIKGVMAWDYEPEDESLMNCLQDLNVVKKEWKVIE